MKLRRTISSVFVLLAYAVIFCHGVVPHHHHHPFVNLQHSDDANEHHDGNDADMGFWEKAFSLFHHEAGAQITYQPAAESVQAPQMNLFADALVPQEYEIYITELPHIVYGKPEPVIIQKSFFSASSFRRGPPVFVMG